MPRIYVTPFHRDELARVHSIMPADFVKKMKDNFKERALSRMQMEQQTIFLCRVLVPLSSNRASPPNATQPQPFTDATSLAVLNQRSAALKTIEAKRDASKIERGGEASSSAPSPSPLHRCFAEHDTRCLGSPLCALPPSLHRRASRRPRLAPVCNGKAFNRIIQVWLENTDFATAASTEAFEIAKQGITLTNYNSVTHPSEPNYVSAIGGDFFGMHEDTKRHER
ncbi:hypothetical protein B0H14DRAFT_3498357 [Mycena olivaceomarginata]|nr:hypothetical protein B0H14DRAFT_3498357 [Mycena olivaceomarginata]